MTSTVSRADPEIFADVLDGAVVEILNHEDPVRFFDWFERRLADSDARRQYGLGDDNPAGEDDIKAFARTFGRALWNAMPLPGNDFRPKPLPAPGRNDACLCGSGRKFKRCCGNGPQPPSLDSQILWPLLLTRLPAKSRQQAIATGRAPITALVGLANEYAEAGKPKKAVELLEPAFAGKAHGHGEDHDFALNLLCNLYDELGYTNKKTALLARIVSETRRSPLRSGALQRQATIKMDAGDPAGAWADFQAAQRDDPKSPSIGLLEVQLLISERRHDLARERARFWVKRLQSLGWPDDDDDGPVAFLKGMARDPEQAMADVGLDMAGGAGRPLLEWLKRVEGRPLPEYSLSHEPPGRSMDAQNDPEAGLAERLQHMGIPEAEFAPMIEDLRSRIAELEMEDLEMEGDKPDEFDETDEFDGLEEPEDESPDSLFLVGPPALAALEAEWHAVFLQDKPFSVHRTAFTEDDVWDPDEEEDWMAFLRAHPEAFDSLDIIDDLATAVEAHPRRGDTMGVAEKLLRPLLRRAHAIIDSALAKSENPQLHWGWTENRPALRSLVRLVYVELDKGNDDAAAAMAQTVLSLNPYDNHGLRTLVINEFLRDGDNERALELARQYPGDLHPELAYGEALALFRLERYGEAQEALDRALDSLPKVPRFLTAERVRKPKIDPIGVRIGGDDQAWLYREEMRDVWDATSDALEWLRKASKRRK